jgi:hypothetical protein
MSSMMNNGSKSAFAEIIAEPKQLEPKEPDFVQNGPRALIPPVHRTSDPSAILLAWAINHWSKSTLTLRDIRTFGPHSIRNPKDALRLAEVLTQFGWLEPIAAWRRDQRKWKVVREINKPSTQ